MEEYFCPKINMVLKVSKASSELCSDCRESSSAKLESAKSSQSGTEIVIMGESLVCHYGGRDFEIPIPEQSMGGYVMGGLARILAEDGAFRIEI